MNFKLKKGLLRNKKDWVATKVLLPIDHTNFNLHFFKFFKNQILIKGDLKIWEGL